MNALLLTAALLFAGADETVLAERVHSARIGAAIAFVVTVGGLVLGARALGRRAKEAEEEQQLADAFRELDEELSRKTPRNPKKEQP